MHHRAFLLDDEYSTVHLKIYTDADVLATEYIVGADFTMNFQIKLMGVHCAY